VESRDCAITLVSCLVQSSILKMEATYSSETSVDFQRATQRYILEDRTLSNCRCENSDAVDFVRTLGALWARPQNIMVSCYGCYSFNRLPFQKFMILLGRHFEEDIMRLFHHVLTSCCFSSVVSPANKLTGVTSLYPVIANFCVEDFEKVVLDWASLVTHLLVQLHLVTSYPVILRSILILFVHCFEGVRRDHIQT
jgi:hypothetical protein